jgi:hypothetical protein
VERSVSADVRAFDGEQEQLSAPAPPSGIDLPLDVVDPATLERVLAASGGAEGGLQVEDVIPASGGATAAAAAAFREAARRSEGGAAQCVVWGEFLRHLASVLAVAATEVAWGDTVIDCH